MKTRWIFVLLALACGTLTAQQDEAELKKIDSLTRLVTDQKGLDRIQSLIYLSEAYRETSIDKSLETGATAEAYALQEGYENMKGVILLSMGKSANLSGDYQLAIDYYTKAAKALEESKNYPELAKAITNLGMVYKNLGDFDQAIEILNRAESIAETHQLTEQLAGTAANKANINLSLGDYDLAMESYQQALQLYKTLDDSLRVGLMTMNIGLVYWKWNKNELALEMLHEAENMFSLLNNQAELGRLYNNIGKIYYQDVKDTTKALDYYERSLAIRESLGNQLGMSIVLANIGSVYGDRGKISEAFEYFNRALRISETIGYLEGIVLTKYYMSLGLQKTGKFKASNLLLDTCLMISKAHGLSYYYNLINRARVNNHAALGDYKSFIAEFKIFSAGYDSLINEAEELKFKELNARKKLAGVQKELTETSDRFKAQNNSLKLYRLLFGFLLLTVIFLLIILMVKHRRKAG